MHTHKNILQIKRIIGYTIFLNWNLLEALLLLFSNEKMNYQCAVSLDNFNQDDEYVLILLPIRNHSFHSQWLIHGFWRILIVRFVGQRLILKDLAMIFILTWAYKEKSRGLNNELELSWVMMGLNQDKTKEINLVVMTQLRGNPFF